MKTARLDWDCGPCSNVMLSEGCAPRLAAGNASVPAKRVDVVPAAPARPDGRTELLPESSSDGLQRGCSRVGRSVGLATKTPQPTDMAKTGQKIRHQDRAIKRLARCQSANH